MHSRKSSGAGQQCEPEEFLVERRFSEWQRKDVRTIIVNSRSKIAAQRSINQALRIANPLDRIELVGGEYFESVSLSFPVELVAAEGEDVKIVFRGQCLTVATDCACYIADIEFISKSRGRADAALVVSLGRPVLHRCRFSSVQLCGQGYATLERCEILMSVSGVGVRVLERGGGMLVDCRVHSHGSCCVDVDTSGQLEFLRCHLFQPHRGTVVVVGATSSSYADSPGRACRQVTFSSCKIYAADAPVVVDALRAAMGEEATPMLSSAGEKACVIICHGSEPVFNSNELLQGDIGFLLESGGRARLTANVIRMQKKCGVSVMLPPLDTGASAPAVVLDGGNLFDRCRVGVDISCGGCGRVWEDGLMAWLPNPPQPRLSDLALASSFPADGERFAFHRDGSLRTLAQLENQLRLLLTDLVVAYVSTQQPVCAGAPLVALVGADGTPATSPPQLKAGAAGLGVSFLSQLLDHDSVERRRDPAAVTAAQSRIRAGASIGIEISEAKFFSCPDGGVVFRAGSRGVVTKCEFMQCQSSALMIYEFATPIVVSCSFSQCPQSAVHVHSLADPILACNDVSTNSGSGLLLDGASYGLVLGNRIHANSVFGVVSRAGSRAVLYGNEIRENLRGGLHLTQRSYASVIHNQLTGNFSAQILVEHASAPHLLLNHVASGPGYGAVVFSSCSSGLLAQNKVLNNKCDGVVLELDADPVVVENDILENEGFGLVVRNSGTGTIERNRICRNRQSNVSLSEGAYATLRANHIEGGHLGGVHVHDEGTGLIEKNLLTGNSKANLLVSGSHTHPVVDRNTISGCRTGPGVLCFNKCRGAITRNIISDNKSCGVSILSEGDPSVVRNAIFRETIGVVVSSNGKGVLERNEMYDNSVAGMVCETLGSPTATENNFSSNRGCGLLLTVDALGKFSRNRMQKNVIGVQCGGVSFYYDGAASANCGSSAPPSETAVTNMAASLDVAGQMAVISENIITENATCGVLLEEDANSKFVRNKINRNAHYGVLGDITVALHRRQTVLGVSDGGQQRQDATPRNAGGSFIPIRRSGASFEFNDITLHGIANVCFLNHAMNEFVFSKNTIADAPRGVLARGNSFSGVYRDNTIRSCIEGISVEENSSGLFEGNAITECSMCGVYVSDGANPSFTKNNTVSNCGVAGIFVDAGGKGRFSECQVSSCGIGCASACPPPTLGLSLVSFVDGETGDFQPTTPIVEDCSFSRNRAHGILVLSYESLLALRSCREARAAALSGDLTSDCSRNAGAGSDASPKTIYGRDHRFEDRSCPTFRRNLISENRFAGIFHERFAFISTSGEASPDTVSDLQLSQTRTPGGGDDSPGKQRRGRTAGSARRPHANISSPRQKTAVARRGSHVADRASLGSDKMEYSTVEQDHLRLMLQCAAFVENIVTRNAFGVIVSGESDPFLLRNKICENAFYGILLRSTSRPLFFGCTISGNGLAGAYCCRFANGTIDECSIKSNNGLFVAQDSKNMSQREDRHAALRFILSNFSYKKPTVAAGSTAVRGCEQLELLLEVHEIVLQGSVDLLEDVVAAGRPALSIASFLLPNPYASSSQASEAALRSSDYADGAKLMEHCNTVPISDGAVGVYLEHGSQVEVVRCVIENHTHAGALFSCSILGHHFLQCSNIGVASRVAIGPISEGAAVVKSTRGAATEQRSGDVTPRRTINKSTRALYAIPTPGVLFTQHPLVHNAATTGASDETLLERTWMGCDVQPSDAMERSLSFGPSKVAKGLSAAQLQLADNNGRKQAGAPMLRECVFCENQDGVRIQLFQMHLASASVAPAATVQLLKSSTTSGSLVSSESSSVLQKSGSGAKWGVVRQKTKQLARSASQSSADGGESSGPDIPAVDSVGQAQALPATSVTFASSPQRKGGAVAPSVAQVLQHVFDGELDVLHFAVTLQGNTFERQSGCGVYIEHVVEVNAASLFATPHALQQLYTQQIVAITKAKTILRDAASGTSSGPSEFSASTTNLTVRPISVTPGRLSLSRHAKLTGNIFRANKMAHLDVTSRFVAVTADRSRILLNIESTGETAVSSSIFAPSNVMAVPVLRDLVQSPPPGIVLIAENQFLSAPVGIRFHGMLSSGGSRVRGNLFSGLSRAGVVLDGNRACATIGDGNVFEKNSIGVLLSHDPWDASNIQSTTTGHDVALLESPSQNSSTAPSSSSSIFLWTTKILKNVFRSNTEFGVALFANLPPCASYSSAAVSMMTPELKTVLSLPWWTPPVIFNNTFVEHRGCPALAALGTASTAIITRNILSRNSVGLLASAAACAAGATAATGTGITVSQVGGGDSTLTFEQNTFIENDVGVVVISGGGPPVSGRLNLFKRNVRAGVDYLSHESLQSSGAEVAIGGPRPPGSAVPALKLSDCAFEHHRSSSQSLLQFVPLKFGLNTLLGAQHAILYKYPHTADGAATEPPGSARLRPDADGASRPPLCSGLVLRCATGALLERCAFLANHIGSECFVSPPPAAGAGAPKLRGRETLLQNCAFQTNGIGMLAHHFVGDAMNPGVKSSISSGVYQAPRIDEITSLGKLPATPAELVATAEDRSARFESCSAITARNCLFENNVENDVTLRHCGHIKLVSNLLLTGVSLDQFALGYFSRNVIVASHRNASVIAKAGSMTVFSKNFFYQCRVGIRCAAHSYPLALGNTFFECTKGFEVDANCGACVVGNLVTNASDCGASVRGAVIAKNEFCLCPVGLLVPSSASAAIIAKSPRVSPTRGAPAPSSITSFPSQSPPSVGGGFSSAMMTLASFDLCCMDNTIHSCDSDGLLIGGGGTYEGNQVYNNKVNVNVVYQLHLAQGIQNSLAQAASAALAAGGASGGGLSSSGVPSIVRNTIYDATAIGVLASPSSVAMLTQNDIFDNKIFGLCCENRSQLVAEGNNISCPHMKGAVDVAQDSDCQLHRNTVRNQFSPVYQKTLQPARVKDRAVRLAQLADRVQGEVTEFHSLSAALRDTLNDLLKRHEELSSVTMTMTEIASNADASLASIKAAATSGRGASTTSVPERGARTPQGTSLEIPELASDVDEDEGEGGLKLQRSRSAASHKLKSAVMMVRKMSERRSSCGSSSAASLKKLTRANSNALEFEEDLGILQRRTTSPSSRGSSLASAPAGHVLVHVLTPGHTTAAACASMASSAGNVVAGTLRSSPLVQLTTVVTTEPSAVSSVMKAQLPTSVVLVVPPRAGTDGSGDLAKQFITSVADGELLFRLDRTSSTRKTSNGQRMQCFILAPEDLRRFFMSKKFSAKPGSGAAEDGSSKGKPKKTTGRSDEHRQEKRLSVTSFSRSLEDFSDFHTILYYDQTTELTGLEELVRTVLCSKLYQQATGGSQSQPTSETAAKVSLVDDRLRPNEVHSAASSPQPGAVSTARVLRPSPQRGSSPQPRRIMSPQPAVQHRGELPPIEQTRKKRK
jgi:parallel beta-helix repeat protein